MREFVLFLLVISFVHTEAQYLDIGIHVQGAMYQGDLQPKKFDSSQINRGLSVSASYKFDERWGAKMEATSTYLTGSDAGGPNANRNLSFRTHLYEVSLMGEYTFYSFPIKNNSVDFIGSLGMAVYNYNPQGQFNGAWYDLQPYGTEGQYIDGPGPYKLIRLALPVGLAVKFHTSTRLSFGLSATYRLTNNDHLDDVSGAYPDLKDLEAIDPIAAGLSNPAINKSSNPPTGNRGNPEANDGYYSAGISFYYSIISKKQAFHKKAAKWW